MGKWINDDALDAGLKAVIDNCNKLFLCSAQPTTYAEASSDFALAEQDLTTGDGNGDYTIADGDSSGRKATVAAQQIASADADGTATHVALCDSANSKLWYVAITGTSFPVVSGQPVNVDAFAVNFADVV